MALPPKRAANRRRMNGSDRGRTGGGGGDPGQRPERGVDIPSHSSPYSRHTQGGGSVAGAGMLDTTDHHKPGPAANRKMGMGPEAYPSRPIPSGSTPSGMRGGRNEP